MEALVKKRDALKKILVTGNMGYVGPAVVKKLREEYPEATLIGYDLGYFAGLLTCARSWPERVLDAQFYGDVRSFPAEFLAGVDAIVHLAAISNDPMGNRYAEITYDVNCRASLRLAELAKAAGVRSFVFASSCSTYGFAEEGERKEGSPVNPLTAYARSKVDTEEGLGKFADHDFAVTCLRFATACGMSDRLRLDLVLNDFVASAVSCGSIKILSDGTPWRPLVHVMDMARGIAWGLQRDEKQGGRFLVVNVGSNHWNYQVKDLAAEVKEVMPEVEVEINRNAQPDCRSYRVNFDLFASSAPDHQPIWDLQRTILQLKQGLDKIGFADADFRSSRLMRLKALEELKEFGELDDDLRWNAGPRARIGGEAS